jgi:hypothetical protein
MDALDIVSNVMADGDGMGWDGWGTNALLDDPDL